MFATGLAIAASKLRLWASLLHCTYSSETVLQVQCEFVACLREGWLQYRKEPKAVIRSWKVGWFELLADGKLSWFPSPSKTPSESRQECTTP